MKMKRKTRFIIIGVSDFAMIAILFINAYQGLLFSMGSIIPVGVILLNCYTIYYFMKTNSDR